MFTTENSTNLPEGMDVACCIVIGSRPTTPAAMNVISPSGANAPVLLLLLGQLATTTYIVVFDKILPTNPLTNLMPIWLLLSIYKFKSLQ